MATRSTDQPGLRDIYKGLSYLVMPPVTSPVRSARPHPWEMVEHPIKTLRFVNDLRRDPHIALVRKLFLPGLMLLLLLAVLLPEGIIAALIAGVLPVAGPAINLPTDAVIDWAFSVSPPMRCWVVAPCGSSPAPCPGISSWRIAKAAATLTASVGAAIVT